MTIDSHIHFWNYNKSRDAWMKGMETLQQDYLPLHIMPVLQQNSIDGCVAVQADQSEAETHFLIEQSKAYPFIKAVIGWIDLQERNVEERLNYFAQYKIIKGWRHIVQAEPEGFLQNKDFKNGIKQLGKLGYTYDLLVYHTQLAEAVRFVAEFPEQKFVLDHCGKPGIKENDISNWEKQVRLLAQYPATYCKLSGLFTETNFKQWEATDFYPYLDVVFDAFGVNRLLFGSDFPVILLSGTYSQWKGLLEQYMKNYAVEDKQNVFGGNAVRVYSI